MIDIQYWASLLSCGRRRKAPQTSLPGPLQDSSGLFGLFNLHDEHSTEHFGLISTTDYARRCRDIMEVYKNLGYLGVHAAIDLPRVVVIGSQSSGKSSLVEAVSGINVPRDSGTCTRCPMECTMSSDAKAWSCTIEIRREYDDSGMRLPSLVTDRFGPLIDKREEVELWIRRAQAAVLGPHRSYSDFYNMSEEELKALPTSQRIFSKNIIHITVRDPEATDLSFVDLPGLITNDEDHLIDTVKGMVEQYISGRNTLIVIAMPMTDDYQNMQAVRLAKEENVDPEGKRTIGVLTKPDMLAPGAIGALTSWSAVLKGNQYQTKHGYYCVRLPNDMDRGRGLSKLDAQEEEINFFNSTTPWSQFEDRNHFGVPNFVKYVSTLLIQLIDEFVPDLRKTIRTELSRCKLELDGLPRVNTEDPWTVIVVRVSNFCSALKETVFGEKDESFVRSNRDLYSVFKQDIVNTTPDFRPFEGDDLSEYTCCVSDTRMVPWGLEHVRKKIQQCYSWELPRHAPYKFKASQTLIRECTSLWAEPAYHCFDEVVEVQTALLQKLIQEHFDHYTNLKGYISGLIFSERGRYRDEAKNMLEKILQMENHPFFTQNFEQLSEQETHWYDLYLQEMNGESGSEDSPTPPPISRLSDGKKVPWKQEDEVRIMANVQAYFQVTHHRIIDNVPLIIEHELHQAFCNRIQNILVGTITKDVKLQGRNFLDDLLREDPTTAERRKHLEDRISRLERVGTQLDQFTHMDKESTSQRGHDHSD